MKGLLYRLVLTVVNIFFPPLTVLILCGVGPDVALNCILFILAVFPSHVHAFCISCVYFWRRRKVNKGIHPGGEISWISSRNVINGGADDRTIVRM
ncbi:hypothetical protein K470DRAFT_192203, partial [Piedraia hortae CBS 480.64]